MISARTQCPECLGPCVVDLADILYSPIVDYFRCQGCGCWWTVPKDTDDPDMRMVYGNPTSTIGSNSPD